MVKHRDYIVRWGLLGALIGAAAGSSALAFHELVSLLQGLVEAAGIKGSPIHAGLIALAALFSGLVAWRISPGAAGPGVDRVVEAYHEEAGGIAGAETVARTAASSILVGVGASAGSVGPAAHIGAGVASRISSLLGLDRYERAVASMAGLAAGAAAILHTPLAAALFAAEAPYRRDFDHTVLYPGLVAALTAYLVDGFFTGYRPPITIPEPASPPSAIILALLAGLLAGALARLFTETYLLAEKLYGRIAQPPLRVLLGGALGGLLVAASPLLAGPGFREAVSAAASPTAIGAAALLYAVAKLAATASTVGCGGSGGLFSPSLFTGAYIGAWTAWLLSLLGIGGPDSYAVVAAAAMAGYTGSVLKAPLTAAVLVVELAGNPALLAATVPGVAAAFLVSGDKSLYRAQKRSRLESPLHRPDIAFELMKTIRVADTEIKKISVSPTTPIAEAAEKMRRNRLSSIPVVEEDTLIGTLYLRDIYRRAAASPHDPAIKYARKTTLTVAPDDILLKAIIYMGAMRTNNIPVTTRNNKYLGIVTLAKASETIAAKLKLSHIINYQTQTPAY